MSQWNRIQRQKTLAEAEGYLDLITVLAERWPPKREVRDRLARRALKTLIGLEEAGASCWELFYLKGQALRAMHRYREAISPLRRAARLEPTDIHARLALGWCYKRIDRLDLAIESLEEALAVDPSETILYYNLACYWSLAGNARLALEYLSEAIEINPDYRNLVHDEQDFDPIRDHPEFQMLTSVIV